MVALRVLWPLHCHADAESSPAQALKLDAFRSTDSLWQEHFALISKLLLVGVAFAMSHCMPGPESQFNCGFDSLFNCVIVFVLKFVDNRVSTC